MDIQPKILKMDSFTLSRNWFNFSFDNPDKVNPNHAALYFFIIEHCNRLGGKEKFGLPMEMAKEAIGIKNYRTYAKTFQDLVDWNFIKLIQKSKNQYSSNVIAIVINAKAPAKALDKALQKHSQSHSQKQGQSIVGIDKQETINNKQVLGEKSTRFIPPTLEEIISYCLERKNDVDACKWFNFYKSKDWMIGKNKMKDWQAAVRTWENNKKNNQNVRTEKNNGNTEDFDNGFFDHLKK